MKETRVIAEIGVNHNGDLGMAKELIRVAASAGCDFVKFQTFDPKKLVKSDVKTAKYQQANAGYISQKSMLQSLAIPPDWYKELIALSESLGVGFSSTGFDRDSVSFLTDLGVPFLKVPSGEITNGPLLLHIARQGLPILLSTGMSTITEIQMALGVIFWGLTQDQKPTNIDEVQQHWASAGPAGHETLAPLVTVLQCTSQYPTPPDAANLKCLSTIRSEFNLPVGFSDHTEGIIAPVIATALGATIVEKHITLDRQLPGPDHRASIEPIELNEMIKAIHQTHQMLGSGTKQPTAVELEQRDIIRQSLIASSDLNAGHTLSEADIETTRISGGRSAMFAWDLTGTSTKKTYKSGELL